MQLQPVSPEDGIISHVTLGTLSAYLVFHLHAGNFFQPLPSPVGIIHVTEVTKDKSAVERVVEGEYEVRHHDEEHGIDDGMMSLIVIMMIVPIHE